MRYWLTLLALVVACSALPARADRGGASPAVTLESLLAGVRVGAPESHGNLAVFPVTVPEKAALPGHLNLDEALAAGVLKVSEVSESGSVNELKVENAGKTPVFIMAGEILTGAKQDRVLQDDVWLPARSGPVAVACYCVEQGRWTYTGEDKHFKSRPVAGNVAVRQSARATNSQSAVWDAVAETQSKAGYGGGSTALGETYNAPEVKKEIDGYLNALADLPKRHPEANGFVVVVGPRILAADLFGSRDDAAALWAKLLPSYALEAAGSDARKPTVTRDHVTAFLRKAAAMKATTRATPGEGTLLSLEGPGMVGSALLVGRSLAHAELFPTDGTAPRRPSPPIQRQYPSDNVQIQQQRLR